MFNDIILDEASMLIIKNMGMYISIVATPIILMCLLVWIGMVSKKRTDSNKLRSVVIPGIFLLFLSFSSWIIPYKFVAGLLYAMSIFALVPVWIYNAITLCLSVLCIVVTLKKQHKINK